MKLKPRLKVDCVRKKTQDKMTRLESSLLNSLNLFPSRETEWMDATLPIRKAKQALEQPMSLDCARLAMLELYVLLCWRKSRLLFAAKDRYMNIRSEENMELEPNVMQGEVLRLLSLCRELLIELKETPNLIHAHDDETKRTLDEAKIAEHNKTLAKEQARVGELEAVVAAIGTMSAGKSTCINAITGLDLLPNRATPMTTYPTKVRHDPDRAEPILEFPLADKFEQFVSNLKEKVKQQLTKSDDDWDEIVTNVDDRKTAKQLIDGKFDNILSEYEGIEKIKDFIMGINDLSRLGGLKNIDIPAPEHSHGEDPSLPILHVRFHHIGDVKYEGKLTILDTPGPNEAGQDRRLWNILENQTKDVSAIIVVADCTQLRTEASDEIERLVRKVKITSSDRFFIFANKFDQLTKDGWDEAQVQSDFAHRLQDAGLDPEQIFPIKGLEGFLANWAARKIETDGRLPGEGEPEWLLSKVFGEKALGITWKNDIGDAERVKNCAQLLWEGSLLDKPLDKVVRMAAKNAAKISLLDGVRRAHQIADVINRVLKLRHNAVSIDADHLAKEIDEMNKNILNAEKAHEKVKHATQNSLQEFQQGVEQTMEEAGIVIEDMIKSYFDKEKRSSLEDSQEAMSFKTRKNQSSHRFLDSTHRFLDSIRKIIGEKSIKGTSRIFMVDGVQDVDDKNICFEGSDSIANANKILDDIQNDLNEIFQSVDTQADSNFQDLVKKTENEFNSIIEQNLGSTLDKAQARLEHTFDIKVNLPKPNISASTVMSGSKSLKSLAEHKKRKEKTLVERETIGGAFLRFIDVFDGDWGYDEKVINVDTVVIKVEKIRSFSTSKIEKFKKMHKDRVDLYIGKNLPNSREKYFNEIDDILKRFSGDIADALGDKKIDEEKQKSFIKDLDKHLDKVKEILLGLDQMEAGLKELS